LRPASLPGVSFMGILQSELIKMSAGNIQL
jgi:hypothetical protein